MLQVLARLCVVGLDPQHLGKMMHGLLESPLTRQDNAQIVVRLGMIRLDL